MTWGTSENKATVEAYMEAYAKWDHKAVLACLTDDVEWYIPGAANLKGKAAFDAAIEGEGNSGPPKISVDRLVEEDDIVVAEGQVIAPLEGGNTLQLVYCDVFLMRQGKIRQLTSYLVQVPEVQLL
jgi:ketosteroid isomerase-like protein